jgi:hypothetical protein
VRGRKRDIKMDERDYLSLVQERKENEFYRFDRVYVIYCCLLNPVQNLI